MLNNTEITTSRDRDASLPRTRVAEINSPDPPRGPNSVSQAHTRFVIVKHRLPEGGGVSLKYGPLSLPVLYARWPKFQVIL